MAPYPAPRKGDRTVLRYHRVVVKLSGEALAGSAGAGVDPASLAQEQGLRMHVFNVAGTGVMRQICQGAELGTTLGTGVAD